MDDATLGLWVLAIAGVIGLAIRIGLAMWFSRLPERWGRAHGLELVERGPLLTTKPPYSCLKYRDRQTGESVHARLIIPGWWTVHIEQIDN